MRLAINAVRVSSQGGGGIDHYVIHLVNQLALLGVSFDLYTFSPQHFKSVDPARIIHPLPFLHSNPVNSEDIAQSRSQSRSGFLAFKRKFSILFGDAVKMLWTQTIFPFCLLFKRTDLLFTPSQMDALPFCPFGVKQVIAVLDLIPFILKDQKHKHMFFLRGVFPLALKNSKCIITISENTKKDVVQFFKVPPEKITATLLAKPEFSNSSQPPSREDIEQVKKKYSLVKYILCVSSNHPHKNLIRLIQAYDLIWKEIRGCTLLNVGYQDKSIQTGLDQMLNEKGLSEKVKFLGHVEARDLPPLYAGAEAFVFPSVYEGFGLPPLEAMSYGVPVVLSNSSSLPEVAGEAGIYFDPYNKEDIAQKIKTVLTDTALKDRLKKLSLERAKKFSWEKTAKETLAVFKKALEPDGA